jgi:hypothetical protein
MAIILDYVTPSRFLGGCFFSYSRLVNIYFFKERTIMEKKISSGLKTTFLVHIIVGAIFGIVMLLFPMAWTAFGVSVKEPEMYRLVGAAILGFTASSWWAYRETAWDKVKIIVQMEVVWTTLAALVILWGLFFAGLPAIEWINAILMAGFAAAFYYFYSKR